MLSPSISIALPHTLQYTSDSPPRINIHHEFGIRPWHDLDVFINSERIIELPSRFSGAMFHIADFAVHTNLNASLPLGWYIRIRSSTLNRRVRVHDCGAEV
jgi:hypothetical protein